MRTIAVINNKGGVGKTLTCINLADILTRVHGKRVVLLDADGQMNLTRFYFPKFNAAEEATVYDILLGQGHDVWDMNLWQIKPGLEILPGDNRLYGLDLDAITGSMDGLTRERILTRLRDIRDCAIEDEAADFMLIDCPPGYTVSSIAALMAAEEVVIPVLVDGFSAFGVKSMAEQVACIRRTNPRIRITGVLINEWRNEDVVREGEALIRSMGVPVFKQVIRRTEKMPESTYKSQPVALYSPGSAASHDFKAWVKELLGEEVR